VEGEEEVVVAAVAAVMAASVAYCYLSVFCS